MTIFKLRNSSDPKAFKSVIAHLHRKSDRVGMIERIGLCGDGLENSITELKPSVSLVQEWPGTRLLGSSAKLYLFNSQKLILTWILDRYMSFEDLVAPHFLEDLFAYSGSELLFYSISHEREYLMTDTDVNRDFLDANPGDWIRE